MAMTSASLADFFRLPDVTPAFLLKAGGWGRKWIASMASLADLTLEGARQASIADSPADCPGDALDYVGADSDIERNPSEGGPAYRVRLVNRFLTHERGARAGVDGYESGVALSLVDLGHEDVRALDLGHGWVFDENVSNPWRFWIVIDQAHPWNELIAGDDVIAGDLTAGITMPYSILRQIRRLIRKWKSAHAIGVRIIVIFSGIIAGEDTFASDTTICGCESVELPIGRICGLAPCDTAGDATICGYYIDY